MKHHPAPALHLRTILEIWCQSRDLTITTQEFWLFIEKITAKFVDTTVVKQAVDFLISQDAKVPFAFYLYLLRENQVDDFDWSTTDIPDNAVRYLDGLSLRTIPGFPSPERQPALLAAYVLAKTDITLPFDSNSDPNNIQMQCSKTLAACLSDNPICTLDRQALDFFVADIFENEHLTTVEKDFLQKLIPKLRERYQKKQITFDNDITKSLFEDVLFPEKSLPTLIGRMLRYDQLDYPTRLMQSDSTGLPDYAIDDVKMRIETIYTQFTTILHAKMAMDSLGIQTTDAVTLPKFDFDNTLIRPWSVLAAVLTQAVYGQAGAVELLQNFEEFVVEKIQFKLESEIPVFQEIIGMLKMLQAEVLQNYAPAQNAIAGLATEDSQGAFGMIELGFPNTGDALVQAKLSNPNHATQNTSNPSHNLHASEVLHELAAHDMSANATISAYSIHDDGDMNDLLEKFDVTLNQIVGDIKNGVAIDVINMSLGISSMTLLNASDMALVLKSETFANIQKNILFLRHHRIPIVIAAGNERTELSDYAIFYKDYDMSLANFFGLIDPSIILVAASGYKTPLAGMPNTNDSLNFGLQVSSFSSGGNFIFRPDVTAVGEGKEYTIAGKKYTNVAGTSFAAPNVARIIANMKAINPRLSVEKIQAIIKKSAIDIAKSDSLLEGAGQIDEQACYYLATYFLHDKEALATAKQLFHFDSTQVEELNYLAKRIAKNVFWRNTFKQSYGE